MTSSDMLKVNVKALLATLPSNKSDDPHDASPGEEYRQLARRLRDLAQKCTRPYARRELLKLSRIYERRAEYLESCAG
jgi:hypothetical protein